MNLKYKQLVAKFAKLGESSEGARATRQPHGQQTGMNQFQKKVFKIEFRYF